IRVDAQSLHRDQRGGTAIDKKIQISRHDLKAGVEAPTGPERIAAADELKMHIRVLPPPTSKTSMACRAPNDSKPQSANFLRKHVRDNKEQTTGASADDGAVHSNILQIAADDEFKALHERSRVPTPYDLGNECSDLGPPTDERMSEALNGVVN